MNNKLIAITKIENGDVKQAVFKALELIIASHQIAKSNLKILLKPNILIGKAPERAVTTHPEVIRAVIQWLRQFNPEKIIVGESSGTRQRGTTENAFKESGIQKVCEEENVEWTSFEKTPRKIFQVKDPLILKEFPASTLLDEVDLIINIPKIKTHSQCILTCTIKNMFGTLILGQKSSTHAKFPRFDDFSSALVDIYSVSKPQLTIIDGYYCQEGNGPTAGDVVKLNLIIAGYDPVALETVVCSIIGFDKKEILYISKAEAKGLGSSDLNKCKIVGLPIDFVKRKFKKPRVLPIAPLPKFLGKYVGKIIFRSHIKFDVSKCKLCSTCWNNCPVQAIDPPKELKQGYIVPKWNKNKCITCYCCAELCPYEAVNFKISIIRNVFTSWLLGILIFFIIAGIGLIWLLLTILNNFF
jgi:uncharacterized protein (DUF362 family)/Pyruvate/2-oxoacid:ferredoxin oxidoreductase delta subunit